MRARACESKQKQTKRFIYFDSRPTSDLIGPDRFGAGVPGLISPNCFGLDPVRMYFLLQVLIVYLFLFCFFTVRTRPAPSALPGTFSDLVPPLWFDTKSKCLGSLITAATL